MWEIQGREVFKKMGRKKQYSRDEVLAKAMELFWQKGFEGAHLNELVRVTGLNRFSLYKEFGGKEGLFQEAFEKYLSQLQEFGKLLQREPLGLKNILDYLEEIVETEWSYGCFFVNTLTQQNVVHQQIMKKVREFSEGSEQALWKNIEAAKQAGDLPPSFETKSLTKFITVFDMGVVTYDMLHPTPQDKRGVLNLLRDLLLGASQPEPARLSLAKENGA